MGFDELVPFIQDVCKRLKHEPDEAELVLLSKIQVRELTVFFDARGTMPDNEIYDKVLYYLKLREKGEAKKFDINAALPDSEKTLSKGSDAKPVVEVVKPPTDVAKGAPSTTSSLPAGTTFAATAVKRTFDSVPFGRHTTELTSVNNATEITVTNNDQRELSYRVCVAKGGDITPADGAELLTLKLVEIVVPPFKTAKVATVQCAAADLRFTTATRQEWR